MGMGVPISIVALGMGSPILYSYGDLGSPKLGVPILAYDTGFYSILTVIMIIAVSSYSSSPNTWPVMRVRHMSQVSEELLNYVFWILQIKQVNV